jgi:hypothetical protein
VSRFGSLVVVLDQVAGHVRITASKINHAYIRSFTMKKKSRIELAREIIANLRRGMNRPATKQSPSNAAGEVTPYIPMPTPRTNTSARRPRQLQTSHW